MNELAFLAYLGAVVLCVGVAIWLQLTVVMHRGYRWLSWGTAAVFGIGTLPQVLAQPSVQALGQLVLLASAPLIVIPFQVRMIRLISGREEASARAPQRGPGGGRIRARDRRRR